MIVIIIGKSGTGKNVITKQLLKTHPEYVPWLMYTTREPRKGEKDAIDYFFCTPEYLLELQQDGKIIFSQTFYRTNGPAIYATRVIPTRRAQKNDYILSEQNAISARKIKEYYEKKNVRVTCILLETDDEIRRKRLIDRGSLSIEEIDRRWKSENGDLQYDDDQIRDIVDYRFKNNEFEDMETISKSISNIILLTEKGII